MVRLLIGLLAGLLVIGASFAQQKEQRVALVIGNASYKSAPLVNPVNDARAMATRLRSLGFDVTLKENLKTREIGGTYREFRSKIKPGVTALVFYAGHGIQVKGQNYFPAVDAEIDSEEDVPLQSLNLGTLLENMEESKAGVSLVFLDACRDNPFARRFRSASRGLAKVEAASGTLIHYATKPGSVASDGDGKNGTYTEALLAQLGSRLPVELMLKQVTNTVVAKTKGKQEPWIEGSLRGDFYFNTLTLQKIQVEPTTLVNDLSANERTFWESVKDSRNGDELRAYLNRFPNGLFVELAQSRLKGIALPAQLVVSQPVKATTPVTSVAPPKGDAEAQRLFRLATENNDAMAQAYLGSMYENGRGGLVKDEVEAVRLYKLAAAQNYAGGQLGLGYMYESGRGGLSKDEVEAVRLYKLAAAQNDAIARTNLAVMYENGRGGLVKDEVEAVRLYKLAAAQNDAYAQTRLGGMYANGRAGLARDDVEAVRLYKLAAAQSYARAQTSLGAMHANGRGGLVKDEVEAVRLYKLAAAQNYAAAQFNLGISYAVGRGGLTKDDIEAARLYRLSANQNNALAQFNLALFFEGGRGGLPRDLSQAKEWYRRAAAQGFPPAKTALDRLSG